MIRVFILRNQTIQRSFQRLIPWISSLLKPQSAAFDRHSYLHDNIIGEHRTTDFQQVMSLVGVYAPEPVVAGFVGPSHEHLTTERWKFSDDCQGNGENIITRKNMNLAALLRVRPRLDQIHHGSPTDTDHTMDCRIRKNHFAKRVCPPYHCVFDPCWVK